MTCIIVNTKDIDFCSVKLQLYLYYNHYLVRSLTMYTFVLLIVVNPYCDIQIPSYFLCV